MPDARLLTDAEIRALPRFSVRPAVGKSMRLDGVSMPDLQALLEAQLAKADATRPTANGQQDAVREALIRIEVMAANRGQAEILSEVRGLLSAQPARTTREAALEAAANDVLICWRSGELHSEGNEARIRMDQLHRVLTATAPPAAQGMEEKP